VDDEEALKKIQYYIEIGAIRLAGYNEDGEAVFELNEETTKELAPEWNMLITALLNYLKMVL
jgi:hypothetical protein